MADAMAVDDGPAEEPMPSELNTASQGYGLIVSPNKLAVRAQLFRSRVRSASSCRGAERALNGAGPLDARVGAVRGGRQAQQRCGRHPGAHAPRSQALVGMRMGA